MLKRWIQWASVSVMLRVSCGWGRVLLIGGVCLAMPCALVGKASVVSQKEVAKHDVAQKKTQKTKRRLRSGASSTKNAMQDRGYETKKKVNLLLVGVAVVMVGAVIYVVCFDQPGNALEELRALARDQDNMAFEENVQNSSQRELAASIVNHFKTIENATDKDVYGGRILPKNLLQDANDVDNVIHIYHNGPYIIYDYIEKLKFQVDLYFNKYDGLQGLVSGKSLTKDEVYAMIALYHKEVLRCMTPNSPYYDGTRDLFAVGNQQGPDVVHVSNGTTFTFGESIDSIIQTIIRNSGDQHLKTLYNKTYTTQEDLQTKDDQCVPGHSFEQSLQDELKGVVGQNVLGSFNFDAALGKLLSQDGALKAAYEANYLTREHLLALYIYTYSDELANLYTGAQTHQYVDAATSLEKIKYFCVVYGDFLKIKDCLHANPSFGVVFPVFTGLVRGVPPLLYRGLRIPPQRPLVFPSFKGEASTLTSTTPSWDVAKFFTSLRGKGYILGLSPCNHEKVLDVKNLSNVDYEDEILITGGQYQIDKIYLTRV